MSEIPLPNKRIRKNFGKIKKIIEIRVSDKGFYWKRIP